jgi:hypothetical protein
MVKLDRYYKISRLAMDRELPADSKLWSVRPNNEDTTLAHRIADMDINFLPEGFDQWKLVDGDGWMVAHYAARRGHLPYNFVKWYLRTQTIEHDSVAHIAAKYGQIPENFPSECWRIKNRLGDSVAHIAAGKGYLPRDFKDWGLTDKDGDSVAHIAAMNGTLPKDLPTKYWGYVNNKYITVESYYEEYRREHGVD